MDPLITPPISDAETPIFNAYYLHLYRSWCDPVMIWGTDVETSRLEDYVRRANQASPVLVSPAHVLLQAVGRALAQHPEFNRRVLRRHIYRFRNVDILMALRKRANDQADVFLIKNAGARSLVDIAQEVWQHTQQAARGQFAYREEEQRFRRLPRPVATWLLRFRLWLINNLNLPADPTNERLRCPAALVNYLAFSGAPPMRAFKPSRFPCDSCTLNITMGPSEPRPVVVDNRVVSRPVAPLFVRADHRLVDAYDLGRFVATLRALLSEPRRMEEGASAAQLTATPIHASLPTPP